MFQFNKIDSSYNSNLNLELHQMNVKISFLNDELDKEIYMEQPIGFIKKGEEGKVYRL